MLTFTISWIYLTQRVKLPLHARTFHFYFFLHSVSTRLTTVHVCILNTHTHVGLSGCSWFMTSDLAWPSFHLFFTAGLAPEFGHSIFFFPLYFLSFSRSPSSACWNHRETFYIGANPNSDLYLFRKPHRHT